MATLLQWDGPMLDPIYQNTQTPVSDEMVLCYRAVFDVPVMPYVVYNLQQCPRYFTNPVIDNIPYKNLMLIRRECSPNRDAPNCMEVRLTYSNNIGSLEMDGKFAFIINPLERPAIPTWGKYTVREAVEEAMETIDGKDKATIPVTTTAGEPMVLEEEFRRRMVTVRKNVAKVTNDVFAESGDFINEEDCEIGGHTFKKLTLLSLPIEIEDQKIENGTLYYPITMVFFHNPNTWIRRIRNAGFYMRSFNYKIDDKGKKFYPLEPIMFSNGKRADRPVLLDKEGHPIQAKITGRSDRSDEPAGNNNKIDYELHSPDDFGRAFTKDELQSTIRYFRTRKLLNFTQNYPLR